MTSKREVSQDQKPKTARPVRERVCIVCCNPITKNKFPGRMEKGWVWCSQKCLWWKPHDVVGIEMRFGGDIRPDIRQILIDTTRQFDTLKAQSDALGCSIPYLYHMIKRYFSVDLSTFIVQHGTGSRKARYEKAMSTRQGREAISRMEEPSVAA